MSRELKAEALRDTLFFRKKDCSCVHTCTLHSTFLFFLFDLFSLDNLTLKVDVIYKYRFVWKRWDASHYRRLRRAANRG